MASSASAAPPSPLGPEAARLGAVLREARRDAGLRLRDVAARSGTSTTTLSLLERGYRPVGAALLERIVAITGADGGEAFRLAGMVPPQAAAEVLGPALTGALVGGSLRPAARSALRRVHLAELAASVSRPGVVPPIDIEEVLYRDFGIDLRAAEGVAWGRLSTTELVEYAPALDSDGRRAERNFMLGHMAGHAVLARESGRRPACANTVGGAAEAEATWLAGLLLMPRRMLESEAHLLAADYRIDSQEGFESFVAEVAGAFAVPAWLAARHMADAGLLAWAAGQEEV